MTFGQLRTFREVARHGSIRGAAAALVVTEPSVSAAVGALQRELGVSLVERVGRGIRLTAAGEELARHAAEIVGLSEHAARRVREVAGQMGTINLAAVTTAGEYVLPPVLKLFRRRHAEVQVRVEVGNRAEMLRQLLSREADLGIGGRPPGDSGIFGEAFLANDLVVVAAPDNQLVGQRRLEPGILTQETWLLREGGSGTRQTTEEFFTERGIVPRSVMTLGSNGAVKQAAAAGLGITLISRDAVSADLTAGTLVRLPVRGTPLKRWWYILYLERGVPAESTRAFLDLLRSQATRQAVDEWLHPRGEGERGPSPRPA